MTTTKKTKKRGPGRPPKPPQERCVHLAVSIKKSDVDRLRKAAKRAKATVSGIVAELVGRWLDQEERT